MFFIPQKKNLIVVQPMKTLNFVIWSLFNQRDLILSHGIFVKPMRALDLITRCSFNQCDLISIHIIFLTNESLGLIHVILYQPMRVLD